MSDQNFQFSTLDGWLSGVGHSGYDAVSPPDGGKNRRKIKTVVQLQDRNLWQQQRQAAIATSQDMVRNFATVSWAVRKHLDYVSALRWKPMTEDREFNAQLRQWYTRWSRRFNCDISMRHSFRRMIRIAEARRVVDGDIFMAKIGGTTKKRGKLQPIESYRIADPFMSMTSSDLKGAGLSLSNQADWHNGVELDTNGAAKRYAIFSRDIWGSSKFDRFIAANKVCSVGYYERFDQVRGVSPLLAGLQAYVDCSDNINMQQAKMRVGALFGLTLFRDAPVSEDQHGGPIPTEDANEDGAEDSAYEYDFSGGPQLMDLEAGDRAEIIESKTPAAEVVEFLRFMLNIALKTLDLPDSFLREGETNFFGSRAALHLYLRACEDKQKDLMEFLDEIMRWRIGMAIADADILMPRGMQFEDVQWKWVPTGFPWAWDPLKEAKGSKEAIELGADNIERVSALNGTDPDENADINKKHYDYIEQLDIKLPWVDPVDPESMEDETTEDRVANGQIR